MTCKHERLFIQATVGVYADKPRPDGSYVLGKDRPLIEAGFQSARCQDCDEQFRTDTNVNVGEWLQAFYEEANVKMLRWQCDECGGNEIDAPAGNIPEGWDVDDEDDLETCRAVCPECVAKGLSA